MRHMLRLARTFRDFPVLSMRNSTQVATATDSVINPNNLKIEGWYCKDSVSKKTLILLSQDIREVSPQGFIINDHEVLAEKEDLVRLSKYINLHFALFNKKVVTSNGRTMGKVTDYAIDTEAMLVQKLYVSQTLAKTFQGDAVIDRRQIVAIDNKTITVRDTDVPIEEPISQLLKVKHRVAPAYPSPSSASSTKE